MTTRGHMSASEGTGPIVIESQREGEGGLLLALGPRPDQNRKGELGSPRGLVGRAHRDGPKGFRTRRVEKRSS